MNTDPSRGNEHNNKSHGFAIYYTMLSLNYINFILFQFFIN